MKRLNIRCASLLTFTLMTTAAFAATCGDTGAGFEGWKKDFATATKKADFKKKGLATYATKTIAADRNQKSFKYTLEKFMQVRGWATIISEGRKKKASNAAFFASLEKKYGVPAGVIIARLVEGTERH